MALSLLLQLNQAALDLKVVELVPQRRRAVRGASAPVRAASHAVILLDVYGSLHYAGARTLQQRLPDPAGTEVPVVVLRMRGRSTLGATFFTVLAAYAEQLAARRRPALRLRASTRCSSPRPSAPARSPTTGR